jgi:hypothetical protein
MPRNLSRAKANNIFSKSSQCLPRRFPLSTIEPVARHNCSVCRPYPLRFHSVPSRHVRCCLPRRGSMGRSTPRDETRNESCALGPMAAAHVRLLSCASVDLPAAAALLAPVLHSFAPCAASAAVRCDVARCVCAAVPPAASTHRPAAGARSAGYHIRLDRRGAAGAFRTLVRYSRQSCRNPCMLALDLASPPLLCGKQAL